MTSQSDQYERGLEKNSANYQPLSPLGYLTKAALTYPDKLAVVDRERRLSYREMLARCIRLASALDGLGVGVGDTVSVMSPNSIALLEAHYGVPMTGAVLNALNYRLDAETIAFILNHAETKVLLTDKEYAPVIEAALKRVDHPIIVIDIEPSEPTSGHLLGDLDYEAFLDSGDESFDWHLPSDEWNAIALNYTSGTTGNPKGVVYHHRGAFLNAMSNALVFGLRPDSVYLWTLPMFHCSGWTYTWGVTAVGGTHVALRNVDPSRIFELVDAHCVTHLCGAPIVLNAIANAPEAESVSFDHVVEAATGGAAPPSAVIARMERMGFRVTHLYGLTEVYGPATYCAWQEAWAELDIETKASKMARQGVAYPTLTDAMVADPGSLIPVPRDGDTIGEIMIRGSTVMKGYLKNESATAAAFDGGWFRTGDLAVVHEDGYLEIKDRSKDIIISGGENISSLEVEEALYKHPCVLEAAVVAKPDERWGETPCAFITLRDDVDASDEAALAEQLRQWCREHLAHYKTPQFFVFGGLPKTNTGKIQKYVLRDRAQSKAGQPS